MKTERPILTGLSVFSEKTKIFFFLANSNLPSIRKHYLSRTGGITKLEIFAT